MSKASAMVVAVQVCEPTGFGRPDDAVVVGAPSAADDEVVVTVVVAVVVAVADVPAFWPSRPVADIYSNVISDRVRNKLRH